MNYKNMGLILAGVVWSMQGIASALPNIIYILCDDLGYGDVGICNPAGKIPTPNMDRLGREGMVFTDAHSNSSVCTDTTCLTDMLATCADIVGVKLPGAAGEDSVSMLPNLLGKADKAVREATVHHSINGTFAIRQGKWKLIDAPHSGGWSTPHPKDKELYKDLPTIQLYDMEADPGETTNLQDKHPETVEHLKNLLEKYKNDGRSTPAT